MVLLSHVMRSLEVSSLQLGRQLNSCLSGLQLSVCSHPTILRVGLILLVAVCFLHVICIPESVTSHESMVQSQCLQEWEELMSILCVCIFKKKSGGDKKVLEILSLKCM